MKFKVKHLVRMKKELGVGTIVDIVDEATKSIIYGRITIGKSDIRFGKFPRNILNKVVGSIAFETNVEPLHIVAYVM